MTDDINRVAPLQADITEPAINTQSTMVGPGARLRIARESASLAIEPVAQYLHLKPQTIMALENDDYDFGIEPIYIRGYIRSYAKLLGLPGDELILAFNLLIKDEEQPIIVTRHEEKFTIPRRDTVFRQLSLLVLAGVVLSSTTWFFYENPNLLRVANLFKHQAVSKSSIQKTDKRETTQAKLTKVPKQYSSTGEFVAESLELNRSHKTAMSGKKS